MEKLGGNMPGGKGKRAWNAEGLLGVWRDSHVP